MNPLSTVWTIFFLILGLNICGANGYYDDDVASQATLIWIIVIVIVIIIKVAVVTWYIIRRNRRRRAMAANPNLYPARLPGQGPYPPPPPGYGTPQAAYGYPGYPQGYPQGNPQGYPQGYGQVPPPPQTVNPDMPPGQDAPPPSYEASNAEVKTGGHEKY